MARVATKTTVTATASADKLDNGKADTGKWTAGPVRKTTAAKLTSGSDPALLMAVCTFTFAGSLQGVQVSDTSSVTLSPGSTRLQTAQSSVLLDGDSAQDSFGNTLSVTVPVSSKLNSGKA
jgi:hypothetical protein